MGDPGAGGVVGTRRGEGRPVIVPLAAAAAADNVEVVDNAGDAGMGVEDILLLSVHDRLWRKYVFNYFRRACHMATTSKN